MSSSTIVEHWLHFIIKKIIIESEYNRLKLFVKNLLTYHEKFRTALFAISRWRKRIIDYKFSLSIAYAYGVDFAIFFANTQTSELFLHLRLQTSKINISQISLLFH